MLRGGKSINEQAAEEDMGKILIALQWFTILSACASCAPNDPSSEKGSEVNGAAAESELLHHVDSAQDAKFNGFYRKWYWPRYGHHGHGPSPAFIDRSCKPECGAGTACKQGHCVVADCPKGQTRCGGECIDTRSDDMNCGACGYASTVSSYVKAQPCRPDPRTGVCGCDPNLNDLVTICGDLCADISADSGNCGACGHACKADERCESGVCVAACAAGQILVKRDDNPYPSYECFDGPPGDHCAGAGIGEPASCVAGHCQCEPGFTLCSAQDIPSFRYCADLANDREHCGSCNQICGTGTQCVAGACKPIVCPAGQIRCADTCVDPNTDERACGGCTGLFAVPREIGGEDQIWGDDTGVSEATCNNGECYCDVWSGPPDRCVVGDHAYCANFQKDRENCGGCGVTCANDEHCVAGACVPECGPGLGFEFAPPELMMANLRGFCVNGNVVGTSCVAEASCEAGHCVCPNGQVPCRNPNDVADGASETHCTDLSSSLLHCGACGVRCAQGMTCSNGQCVPLTCPAGQVACGNECKDVTTDPNNCGSCSWLSGRWAFFEGSDDASPNCANPWSCTCTWPGVPDVCGNQCTDLQRDQYNCGGCGIACPEGQACRSGQCGQACAPGQIYCDGYCVLGATCGKTCDPSKERCLAGDCVPTSQ